MAVIWIRKIENASHRSGGKGITIKISQRHGLWRPIIDGRTYSTDGEEIAIPPEDKVHLAEACLITTPNDGSFEIRGGGGKLSFEVVPVNDVDHLQVKDARGDLIVDLALGTKGAVLGTEYVVHMTLRETDLDFAVLEVRAIFGFDADMRAALEKGFKEASRALFYALSTSSSDLIKPVLAR
jgi:hypothetical protein